MKILGVGVDIIEIDKIAKMDIQMISKKILSSVEYNFFVNIKNIKNKLNFVAGRWSCKEAIFKTGYTINKTNNFHDYTILNSDNGSPYLQNVDENHKVMMSISHSDKYVVSFVILIKD